MNGWGKREPRVLVRADSPALAKKRIEELEKSGFRPIMEIKEDIDYYGKSSYVCVMENPKYKNPSE